MTELIAIGSKSGQPYYMEQDGFLSGPELAGRARCFGPVGIYTGTPSYDRWLEVRRMSAAFLIETDEDEFLLVVGNSTRVTRSRFEKEAGILNGPR